MSKTSAWHLEEQENPTWGNKTSYKNPVFQKRHYEFIADILKSVNENDIKYFSDIIETFANKFKEISPKNNDGKPIFDRKKFLDRINK